MQATATRMSTEEQLVEHVARLARKTEALDDFAALVAHDVKSSLLDALRDEDPREGNRSYPPRGDRRALRRPRSRRATRRRRRRAGARAVIRPRARRPPPARTRTHEPGDRQEALHLG